MKSWIFSLSNIGGIAIMSLLLPLIFTYTLPYWVNVVGIFTTAVLVQLVAVGVYALWSIGRDLFTKS